MEAGTLRAGHLRGIGLGVVALIAALALAIVPARANAATPVLEFASPGNPFPIEFEAFGENVSARLGEFDKIVNCDEAEGFGDITGQRTTRSMYFFTGCAAEDLGGGGRLKCTSPSAEEEEEIWSEEIDAELVYLDQSKHEVAMLLNPGGGTYMEFDCGTNDIKAQGSFLAPVTPVNTLLSFFTAELNRNGNSQIPTLYEDLNGVKHQAIPTAIVNGEAPDNSGVGLEFTIATGVPLEIKSVNAAEVEAKQRAEEEAAAKKRQEEEAAAKKRQEDEAAAKKRAEEETAAREALARRQAEEKAAAQKAAAHERQMRTKGLKRCRSLDAKPRRIKCETRVKKKYSASKGKNGPKGGQKN